MFIDSVKIHVKAGDGGRGCDSFFYNRATDRKIPDGGDGGRGADIIIRADRNLATLLDFRYNRHFAAAHGGHASSNNKKGRNAHPLVIRVPEGTTVKDAGTGSILRDLERDQDQVIAAFGGRGGHGNRHGMPATPGEPGQEKDLLIDLRFIADVGLVGFPNTGKSTLISSISNARPKIAAYPFTTRSPVLGVVSSEDARFVVADVPGLIEGSSEGRGLGDKFLRHIERTRLIVHVIDMSGSEGRDPVEDYRVINRELMHYSRNVRAKPQVIAANKMDLAPAARNLKRFTKLVRRKAHPISALRKEGLEALIEAIRKKL